MSMHHRDTECTEKALNENSIQFFLFFPLWSLCLCGE